MYFDFKIVDEDGKERNATQRETYHLNRIKVSSIKNKAYRVMAASLLGVAAVSEFVFGFSSNNYKNLNNARNIERLVNPDSSEEISNKLYQDTLPHNQYQTYLEQNNIDAKNEYLDKLLNASKLQAIISGIAFSLSAFGFAFSTAQKRLNELRKDMSIIDMLNDKKVDKEIKNIYGDYFGLTLEDYLEWQGIDSSNAYELEQSTKNLLFTDEMDLNNIKNNIPATEKIKIFFDKIQAFKDGCKDGYEDGFVEGYADGIKGITKITHTEEYFENLDIDAYKKEFNLNNKTIEYKGSLLASYHEGYDTGYVKGFVEGYADFMDLFILNLTEEKDIEKYTKLKDKIKHEGYVLEQEL